MGLNRTMSGLVLATLVAGAVGCHRDEAQRSRHIFVLLNEDSNHFMVNHIWGSKRNVPMQVADILEYVDQYLRPPVTHFFVNVNGNTLPYDTNVGERCWDVHAAVGCTCLQSPISEDLWKRGIDPYAIMIARAREKKISPWLSMRMNDVHNATESNTCSMSMFWRKHPQFRRCPDALVRSGSGGWSRFCYDYSHPEVRKLMLDEAEEMLGRYDVDGIEFDWMRWPTHLTPGKEQEQKGCLTDFMRQARQLANVSAVTRGHPVRVAVRVHSNPDEALGLGTDVFSWAREGFVDLVVPCNFLTACDFELPLAEWRRRISVENPRVKVVPGTDAFVHPEQSNWKNSTPLTAAELRGFLDRMYREGAVGFYFFNHFEHNRSQEVGHYLSEPGLIDKDKIVGLTRAYPVSYRESTCAGTKEHSGVQFPCRLNERVKIRIAAGTVPASGSCSVRVGFGEKEPSERLLATIRLNGVLAIGHSHVDVGVWPGRGSMSVASVEFAFPVTALRDGLNELELGGVDGELSKAFACELYVKCEEGAAP